MNLDPLLTRAAHLHGTQYAALLKADIAIAKRLRDGGDVPQSWERKRRWLARKLDRERAEFERDLLKVRKEFWR